MPSDMEVLNNDQDFDVTNALLPSNLSNSEDEALPKGNLTLASSTSAKKKKSMGFQSFGNQSSPLNSQSPPVIDFNKTILKAVLQKGYKVPTPIQRKCLPLLMDGNDVVGMARTGSGKTAAFVLPLLQKLKMHSAKFGARGLILSPSRELAMQTQKVTKEFAKYTDLRVCLLIGGDSLEDQFGMMASNPDILIATPGRLLHLIIEMDLNLTSVEYVVFDEADRLFEMGFSVQLHEILYKLPASRQTMLFSATLPKMLVDFAKAGLRDPVLVRLDTDSKISKDLEMAFLLMKSEEKEAALLYLLREHLKIPSIPLGHESGSNNEVDYSAHQTMIFVSTKHHVEYMLMLLRDHARYAVSYIYGALDQTARKQQIDLFRKGKTAILVVTDVAARGIDIPILQNVINFDFVDNSKVFIHRVGRVARAGRRGWAFSMITSEDLPYLIDLQLFLGRPFVTNKDVKNGRHIDYTQDMVIGSLPRELLEGDLEWYKSRLGQSNEMHSQGEVAAKARTLFVKSKVKAATESYKRTRAMIHEDGLFDIVHPLFARLMESDETLQQRKQLISSIQNYRPHETIFEVGNHGNKNEAAHIMRKRRGKLDDTILKRKLNTSSINTAAEPMVKKTKLDLATEKEMTQLFRTEDSHKDEDYYLSHFPKDHQNESGYAMHNSTFTEQARSVVMDLHGDEKEAMAKNKNQLRWDQKKKKFIKGDGTGSNNRKLIKTESGAKISATFKSGRYKDWQEKAKVSLPRIGEQELSSAKTSSLNQQGKRFKHKNTFEPKPLDPLKIGYERKARKLQKRSAASEGGDSLNKLPASMGRGVNKKKELKSVGEIRKSREQKEKRRLKTGRHFKAKQRKGKK